MIGSDGWFDWAIRKPGPSWKQNGGFNPSTLFVGHSVVGYRDAFYEIMNGPARKSVHLFNPQNGPVEQLYPVSAQCWGTGAAIPNNNGLTMELEGGPPGNESEPMTNSQAANLVDVLTDWKRWLGAPGVYRAVHEGGAPWLPGAAPGALTEHIQWYATACPSGRYPWPQIVDRVNGVPPVPQPVQFDLGDARAGIELRPDKQVVFWVGGAQVFSIGDWEGQFRGQLAKNMGHEVEGEPDVWQWLRRHLVAIPGEPNNYDAYWSKDKGD